MEGVATPLPGSDDAAHSSGARVLLLDEDPDLGISLSATEFEAARRLSAVRVVELTAGPWTNPADAIPEQAIGLLVVKGIAGARINVGDRHGLELVSVGDILRPWAGFEPYDGSPVVTSWSVFSPARLAVIETRLAPLLARWPSLLNAIVQRQTIRQRRLLFQLTAMSMNSVEDRLLYEFWHLADRWGRMTAEGVLLPLPLSHRDLADLAGARRPSITAALTSLRRRDLVLPMESRGLWLLRGEPPADLDRLHEQAALGPVSVSG